MTAPVRGKEPLLYGLILLMVLFWSGNYIAAKIALRAMPAMLAVSLRIVIAGIAILPIFAAQQRNPSSRDHWTAKEGFHLFLLGVLGVTLNQVFFVIGVGMTSVAHAGIIIALTPILVLLLAALMGQERISTGAVAGMAIAIAGVAVLQTWRGAAGTAQPSATGDAVVFLAALMFSLFTVFGKRIAERRSAITVNTFGYAGGAVILLPVAIRYLRGLGGPGVTLIGWAAVIYMALFPSVLAYLIYYWALKQIPASRLAAFSYFQPLLAILLAAGILGERVTPAVAWAGLLILAGVMWTERSRRREQPA